MESADKLLAGAIESYKAERYAEAERICRQLTSGPAPASRACFLLGLVLGKTERWPEAARWLQTAAELDPAAPQVWGEWGRACNSLGDYAHAAVCFKRFIELKPEDPDGYFCLGNALHRLGRHEEAVALYSKTVELNPADAPAWNNLGKVLTDLNRLQEAIAAFDRALAARQEPGVTRGNRAITLLKAGRWAEGWRDYESRRSVLTARSYPQPKWNGEELAGKTLFIYAEQGIGDSIQFVRFVALARARVGRIILECQPPLKRLFEHCGLADAVIAVGEEPPPFDARVALASLPGVFQITPETIVAAPYLRAPEGEPLPPVPAQSIKVGLVWAGNPAHHLDAERSIRFEQLKPLLEVGNAAFFSFQPELPARDHAAVRACPQVVNLAGRLTDFWETAALVAKMDLVISVDTAVAHLAGALGMPTWTLVPFAPDWRWLLERSDTVWYQRMRLFRQGRRGDWDPVILQARGELSRLAEAVSRPAAGLL